MAERWNPGMARNKPFGCSIVCVSGLNYRNLDLFNDQMEKEEARTEADTLVGLMICSVVLTYQSAVIPILEKRGWVKATTYYSNGIHDFHPIEVWVKHFDRRSENRRERDAAAGISILLPKRT